MKKSILNRIALFLVLCFFCIVTVQAEYEIEFRENVKVPMRDGVNLTANIFLPKAEGKFPVLLARSPYGKGDEKHGDGRYYTPRGYVVMIQDCRGKGSSEGEWTPFMDDPPPPPPPPPLRMGTTPINGF